MSGDFEALVEVTEALIGRFDTSEDNLRRQALAQLRVAMTRPADNPDIVAAHLHEADVIARKLDDDQLATQVDATAARFALATGELEHAERLARRSLDWAEQAGLDEATEVALISLEVLGRRERMRDMATAAEIFQRAVDVAEQHEGGAWGIRALHELATIDMLRDGSTGSLDDVRELAHRAGVVTTTALIELQLANLWSLGTDLDKALAVARQCQRTAAQVKLKRFVAKALSIEANIAAIRGDRKETERIAQRAEDLLPGDADVLAATHGYARVLGALFRDDLPQAMRESEAAMVWARDTGTASMRARGYYSAIQSPLVGPGRAVALHALLLAAGDGDVAGARRASQVHRRRQGLEPGLPGLCRGRRRGPGRGHGAGQRAGPRGHRALRAVRAVVESPRPPARGSARAARRLGRAGRVDARRCARVRRDVAPQARGGLPRHPAPGGRAGAARRAGHREGTAGPAPAGRHQPGDGRVQARRPGHVERADRRRAVHLTEDRGNARREPHHEDRHVRPPRAGRARGQSEPGLTSRGQRRG